MMKLRSFGIASSLGTAFLAIACGSAATRSGFTTEKEPTETQTPQAGIGGDTTEQVGDSIKTADCNINNAGDADPEADYDGDGYALKNDCNECNKTINKGAQDVGGNGLDEDCSGTPDDEAVACDGKTAIGDGFEAAAAMGLCKKSDGIGWGIIDAKLVKPDGKALTVKTGVGELKSLGVNKPREGKGFFVLSTGKPGPVTTGGGIGTPTGTPKGYPKESPSCSDVPDSPPSAKANDGSALQVKIKVPSNAKSFSYEHFFMTSEFPQYVCSKFNDFFVTMMSPIPAGLPDGNIAFDSKNNPIGVNSGLFRVCKPGTYGIGDPGSILGGGATAQREFACEDGPDLLKGTGLEANKPNGDPGGGGTGWLTTSAPVTPGQDITLLFAVWDSADGALDSTVLLDNFKFSIEDSGTTQTAPADPK